MQLSTVEIETASEKQLIELRRRYEEWLQDDGWFERNPTVTKEPVASVLKRINERLEELR